MQITEDNRSAAACSTALLRELGPAACLYLDVIDVVGEHADAYFRSQDFDPARVLKGIQDGSALIWMSERVVDLMGALVAKYKASDGVDFNRTEDVERLEQFAAQLGVWVWLSGELQRLRADGNQKLLEVCGLGTPPSTSWWRKWCRLRQR